VTPFTATLTARAAALRVVLTGRFDDESALREALATQASGIEVVGWADDLREIEALLRTRDLSAVLHGAVWSEDDDTAAELNDAVTAIRHHTQAPIVLLVQDTGPALVEAALAAGFDDVLVLPQSTETLSFAIRKAGKSGGRHGDAADGGSGGEVITVFSPKGGTGKTVVSTNLAAYLAAKTSKRVLLIDLDLQFGDAAIMLGIDPQRTMHDLVMAPGDLDTGKLAGYTTKHRSGLDILAAPMLPEHAELVTEAKVMKLVQVARESYDLVVIDTSPFFYGPMLALLEPTDQLLLLCGLDVPTLKNVRLSLRTLELLGFPPARTNLVLNRVSADVGLSKDDVEVALGLPVAFEIPNDPIVAPAVNRGTAPALHDSDSEFGKAIARIASALQPVAAAPSRAARSSSSGATRRHRFVPRRLLEGRA
jgi:pilus assembly protein CpaE